MCIVHSINPKGVEFYLSLNELNRKLPPFICGVKLEIVWRGIRLVLVVSVLVWVLVSNTKSDFNF
ncbi:hypothetical protein TSAR_015144 [Trichomalopsis sarcophagae]|uniref:Uncharacterized protein n=1 Tax=Trichomalopsis sarcophagae TaxID=543379 RepID=A0A232F8J5_9HYME|nr:hypothetical protein TSAR_015144 [Trichomalopsis sarcophagae]